MRKAIKLDHTMKQYVDLGILTEPCITVPFKCGSHGAAISLWIKITSLKGHGILSSRLSNNSQGVALWKSDSNTEIGYRILALVKVKRKIICLNIAYNILIYPMG